MIIDILLAVLVLGGVSLIFGALIGILGKVMAVERDEKIDQVLSHLAGANCGGCGFTGCDAFAQALCKGEADVSQCPVTAPEQKQKIAKILGVSVEAEEPTVACVMCNGGNKCKNKYEYRGAQDCKSVASIIGGIKLCSTACLGYGTCEVNCPEGAIKINEDGVAFVDREKCTSCGICIKNCPSNVIERIPKKAKVYIACSNHQKGKEVLDVCANGCIACGICEKACPKGAITMVDNLPKIDYSKCIGCKICVTKCPKKVIKEIN